MRSLAVFADGVDGWVDWFCAVCDGPRLAYAHMVCPPPPTLLEPVSVNGRRRVPSRRNLLGLVEVLAYFHAVRGNRQSISLTELARAISQEDEARLFAVASLHRYPYVREYARRRKSGEPRQRYLKLDVRNAWETLADVMGVLGDGEGGGADVDLVARVFYALCPGFNKLLPKGLANLRDLFAAFPGTFEVSSGKVRCVAPFDDPRPEREIAACYRNDVHTREDLEGMVSLAAAAARFLGVGHAAGIPVEALYAWGRERYAGVPCWGSIGSFRRFLYAFRKSGHYRLADGKVRSDGWRGNGCRIKAIRTVIRVVGETDGFASCETVADIVNRWVPGFGGNLDKARLVKYVRDLSGRDFILDGDGRIADRLAAFDVRWHMACLYYPRHLAKKAALGAGLRFLRGEAPDDYGDCRYSRWVAWMVWILLRWRSESHGLLRQALKDGTAAALRGRRTSFDKVRQAIPGRKIRASALTTNSFGFDRPSRPAGPPC